MFNYRRHSKRSKSTLKYFEKLENEMPLEEKVAFQKALITSLQKELKVANMEIGMLKSEIAELKSKKGNKISGDQKTLINNTLQKFVNIAMNQ